MKYILCVYITPTGILNETKCSKKIRKFLTEMSFDYLYKKDYIVCKYGYTKDLPRRTKKHIKDFDKIESQS